MLKKIAKQVIVIERPAEKDIPSLASSSHCTSPANSGTCAATSISLVKRKVISSASTVDKLQSVVKDLEAKIMRLQSLTCRDSSLSSPEKERCTEVHDSLEVSQVLQDREELSVSSRVFQKNTFSKKK